ncbi:MAG TPA: PQQ-binding-like beta-propeller repeat protein, partial [Gemmataceae bacterium]
MERATRWLCVLAGGVLLFGANRASAQDWPQWRGPNRDAKAAGFKAPQTWPKELTQKWKTTVGEGVATPALVGDRLYVFTRQGGNEVVRALDAASGKEIWKYEYKAPQPQRPGAGFQNEFIGPRSSPTVADGKVLTIGVVGRLTCLDAASGKELWHKDEFRSYPKFYAASSPIVVDGLCVAQLGGGDGAIVAFDLATGEEKWKWADDGTDYGSPVLMTLNGTKAIVTPTAESMVALNAA